MKKPGSQRGWYPFNSPEERWAFWYFWQAGVRSRVTKNRR